MTFTGYLNEKKYSQTTITCYEKSIVRFIAWLIEEALPPESFTYRDLLEFMRHCSHQGITKRTMHHLLSVVRHYGNYLIAEEKRNDNPAAGVSIKGLVRKLPTNLLRVEDMEELYQQYNLQLQVDSSNKIMLGLMIYQGVTVGEILRIELHHLKLREGKILIKGTERSNERLLNLQAVQLPELQQYLKKNKFKEGALLIEPVKKEVSERNINNRIQHMFDQLQKLNPKVINAKQIRSRVITEWLRQNNLRQVQYMAGHKYVSSTERYQTSHLEDLQNELRHHHPMK